MEDFYELLDFDRGRLGDDEEANLEMIKIAYIKKSLVHHPDKGGDPELFKRIKLAYENLKDPEKRKFYDDNGKVKGVEADKEAEVIQAILGSVNKWFIKDDLTIDLVDFVNDDFISLLSGLVVEVDKAESALGRARRSIGMIKTDGDNFISEFFESRIVNIEKFLTTADESKKLFEDCLEMMKGFTWEAMEGLFNEVEPVLFLGDDLNGGGGGGDSHFGIVDYD